MIFQVVLIPPCAAYHPASRRARSPLRRNRRPVLATGSKLFFLRIWNKCSYCLTFFTRAMVLWVQVTQAKTCVPRNLKVEIESTCSPFIVTGEWTCLLLLKSIMSYFVLRRFNIRLFSEHPQGKFSTSALYAVYLYAFFFLNKTLFGQLLQFEGYVWGLVSGYQCEDYKTTHMKLASDIFSSLLFH